MKPTCKFCAAHHDAVEPHPPEAVRAALAELRRTEPKVSVIEVGRKTFQEAREHVAPVTKPPAPRYVTPEPVTKPPIEATVLRNPKGGRPRSHSTSAERQRAYRERHGGGVEAGEEPAS